MRCQHSNDDLVLYCAKCDKLKQRKDEALDAAIVWFNATEQGFAAEIRPDIAKANFYKKAREAGLSVI